MADFTPMMRQYMEVKQQYMDAVLFYRLGDFYESFSTTPCWPPRSLRLPDRQELRAGGACTDVRGPVPFGGRIHSETDQQGL